MTLKRNKKKKKEVLITLKKGSIHTFKEIGYFPLFHIWESNQISNIPRNPQMFEKDSPIILTSLSIFKNVFSKFVTFS